MADKIKDHPNYSGGDLSNPILGLKMRVVSAALGPFIKFHDSILSSLLYSYARMKAAQCLKGVLISMPKLDEILEKLKSIKPEIEKRYQVTEIGVFGSYARNDQTDSSDIDILISFADDASIGLFAYCGMENWLSDVLGEKVDLVMKESLKPRIGQRILSEVIYL